jgi:AcrR family transcriptional regulator
MTTSNLARSYRGMTLEQRRAERRAALIRAAIEVYGARGYRQATVKSVCDAAGLTERYFYESYAGSEELLIASFNAAMHTLFEEITGAAREAGDDRKLRARAMLRAYYSAVQREPRSARVFLIEIRGVSKEVDAAFDKVLQSIGRAVAEILAPEAADDGLLQAGVVGAVMHIALRWIADGYAPALDDVTDTALRLGMVLAGEGG